MVAEVDHERQKWYYAISKYLKENNIVGLTPHAIRIIYYRLLFANNIMASGEALIKEETLGKNY